MWWNKIFFWSSDKLFQRKHRCRKCRRQCVKKVPSFWELKIKTLNNFIMTHKLLLKHLSSQIFQSFKGCCVQPTTNHFLKEITKSMYLRVRKGKKRIINLCSARNFLSFWLWFSDFCTTKTNISTTKRSIYKRYTPTTLNYKYLPKLSMLSQFPTKSLYRTQFLFTLYYY